MPAFFKSSGGYLELKQPYIKDSGGWVPLKKIFQKISTGWVEVWPSEIVYTHTGYGNNMDMAACFGNPTTPGNFIFINKGVIGGTVAGMDPSLVTGQFPEGSTLTFINQGSVLGTGGDGASFIDWTGTVRHPKGGGMALRLDFPTRIDNSIGRIGGGGGGGGASGDFMGNLVHYIAGGGGAGYPAGRARLDTWWNAAGSPGTETAGGLGYAGSTVYGKGGDLGQDGLPELRLADDDKSKIQPGAPGGVSIANTGYILQGSVGMGSDRVHGKDLPGVPGNGQIRFASFTGDGSWGNSLFVNLVVDGPNPLVKTSWHSGGTGITVLKHSETQFSFRALGAGSMMDGMVKRTGIVRFTLTTSNGSDSLLVRVDLCEDYRGWEDTTGTTCFIAGSMVTMADGSKKPIELIGIGEYVRTAIGISRVKGLQRPLLANRPLYCLEDGTFGATGDHSVWTRDPYTMEQWWGVRDIDIWREEAISGEGPNFDGHEPFDLTGMEGQHWDFAHETGWKRSTWKRVDVPGNIRLYHLLVEEGGSYFVDGILVSSMADQSGVNWEAFEWYP